MLRLFLRKCKLNKRIFMTLVLASLFFLITLVTAHTTLVAAQPGTSKNFVVTAFQFGYEPSTITVNLGDNVTIRIRSIDVSHGFYVEGYDLEAKLIMQLNEVDNTYVDETAISFIADKPGAYRIRCGSVTCGNFHPFMIGKLIVEPSLQFPISALLAGLVSVGSVTYLWRKQTDAGIPKPAKRIDLLQIPILKRLVKLRVFQFLLIFPSLVIFVLVIMTGLFGVQVGNKNLSVMFVWILWWVALMLFLVPFGGRAWCMLCPLPSFGEWAQRRAITVKSEKRFGLKLKWPAKLDNIWLQNFAFTCLTIFLGVLMTRPWATGYLMILMILLPLIFGLVFVGRAYCKYICPVSGFIGLYSNYSTLELRARDNENCKEHLHQFQTACQAACPAGIRVQDYVGYVAQGNYSEAIGVIREQMPFVGVCGRICTHPCETQCERRKVDQPVAIRELKRFVADYELNNGGSKASPIPRTKHDKVAVVGSGPAGLACAYDLVRRGYYVTVFEAKPEAGGLLRYGIPEYRLPKAVVDNEIAYIKDLGVEIKTNTCVKSLEELFNKGYKAIFLALGAETSQKLRISGENEPGVIHALDFLRKVNAGEKVDLGARVAVIGGGNAAVDAARVAWRMGAKEVNVVYRRSRAEMPAISSETEAAEKEGVRVHFLAAPTKVLSKDRKLVGIECVKMRLSEPDATGRPRPMPVEGSEFTMEADNVIVAIGQAVNKAALPVDLDFTEKGTLEVDAVTLQTNIAGVFAGGDLVSGPVDVVSAVATGKEAAVSIDLYLQEVDIKEGRQPAWMKVTDVPTDGVPKKDRAQMPLLPIEKRFDCSSEVELGFDEKTATKEALRCLRCGTWMMDCMKGNENGYGCPWFESPQNLSRNAYCGLCMECVKTCPNDNVALNLRKEGEDLYVEPKQGFKKRGLDEAWKAFIMSTLAFLYGLVWMGNYAWLKSMASLADLSQWALYAFGIVWGSTLLLTPVIFLVFVVFSKLLSGNKEIPLRRLFINYSYMLIPISLLAWVAFSVSILLINGSYLISVVSDPFGWGWNLLGTKYYPWKPFFSWAVPYVQIAALLLGLILSIRTVHVISKRTFPTGKQAFRGSLPMVAMLAGYTVLLLWLWVG